MFAVHKLASCGLPWRTLYADHELDGYRTHFTSPAELSALAFDFRFRASVLLASACVEIHERPCVGARTCLLPALGVRLWLALLHSPCWAPPSPPAYLPAWRQARQPFGWSINLPGALLPLRACERVFCTHVPPS